MIASLRGAAGFMGGACRGWPRGGRWRCGGVCLRRSCRPSMWAGDLEARYLARAAANLIYLFAPERIVLGSSVGSAQGLVGRINELVPGLLNDFLEPGLRARFLVEPLVWRAELMPDSSLVGAAVMARDRAGLVWRSESGEVRGTFAEGAGR